MKRLPTLQERLEYYNIYNKKTNKFCGISMYSKILYDAESPVIKWSKKEFIESLINRSVNNSDNIIAIKMSDYERLKKC